MKKKIAFSLLIIFMFIGLCSYYLYSLQKQTSSVDTQPVEKIVIGNIGEYSIFNIIAQEKGYFKANKLDVQIKEYPSGPPEIQDLLAGKISFATAADFVGVRNIFADDDLRILTQVSKHKVFHLLARKDKGIANPTDLKGKTIGVTRQGAGEFYLGRFLLFNNVPLQTIIIRDMTPQQMITELRAGTIDAVVIFDPHAYNLQTELGSRIITWPAQGDQNIFALAYTTQSYINAHPITVSRYVRALLQAEQFTQIHREDAQTIIATKLHYDMAYVRYMWKNFNFTNELNQELILTMEDEARWAIENKLTNRTEVPNYLDYIYFEALEKAKPDAVTIIH